MIRLIPFLVIMLLSSVTYAQELRSIDSLGKAKDSFQNSVIQSSASTQTVFNKPLDSLRLLTNTNRFRDSLKIAGWSDSLRRRVEERFSPQRVTRKLDSLRGLNVSTERIVHFSDSLMHKKDGLLSEVGEKQQALQKKVTGRYDGWMKGIREKFNLDSAGFKPSALDPAVGDPLQKLNVPGTQPPLQGTLPAASLATGTIPGIPSLNAVDFSSLGLSEDLVKVGGDLAVPSVDQLSGMDKNLPSMPDPMQEINGQLAEVKELTKDPGAASEKAVVQIGEVNDATKAFNEAEKLKEQNEALKLADQMKDSDALKEKAIDHFAGQEASLTGAMSQMSKYKRKYASLGSLSEIKKNDWLPRNGLKGQPFRERFRIGLHTGFKGQGDTLLLDFYPNASYRITGRLEAGLGVIYRVRINTKDFSFDQHNPVWGTSMFALVKTFKAVHLRFEVDGNSFPKSAPPDQPATRDWRWTFHSGIQTNFKLGKQWTGIIQMLYNFDSSLKDGFPERLTARVGVQYKLK